MLMTDAQTEIILSRVLFTELPRERACLAGRDVCSSETNYKSKKKNISVYGVRLCVHLVVALRVFICISCIDQSGLLLVCSAR